MAEGHWYFCYACCFVLHPSKWHESVTDKSANAGRVQFGLDSADNPRQYKGLIPAQLPYPQVRKTNQTSMVGSSWVLFQSAAVIALLPSDPCPMKSFSTLTCT